MLPGIPNIATAGVAILPNINPAQFTSLLTAGIRNPILGVVAGVGAAAGAVFTASLGAAVASSNATVAFEGAFTRMETLAGESAESVAMLREEVLGLSHLGQGPQDLADTLAFITSSGFSGADALAVLERSAASAAVQMGEMRSVADLVTSAMNAYGQATYSAADVTDLLLRAVRVGKADPDELARSLGRVLPIASELGVGLEELVAAVAALSLTGLSAAEATTAVRAILTTLANPTDQARTALAEYGVTAADLRDMLAGDGGLEGVLFALAGAFDGNLDAVGDLFGNVRALNGVMSLTGDNAKQVRAAFDEVANSTYTLDDALERVAGTDAHRRAVAIAEIQNALVGEGSGSAEAITRLYEGAADVLPELIPLLTEMGENLLFLATDALPPTVDAIAGFVDALNRLADNPIWQTVRRSLIGDESFPGEDELKGRFEDFVRQWIAMQSDAVRAIGESTTVEGSPWVALADWLDDDFSRIMFGPSEARSPFVGWDLELEWVAAGAEKAADAVGDLAGRVDVLPSSLIPTGWTPQVSDLTSLLSDAVTSVSNLGDVMREVSDPTFAAASAIQRFADAQAAWEASGSTDDALAYGQALLSVQAAVGGLDASNVEGFLTTLASLGIDGQAILDSLGLRLDEFGNVAGGVFSGVELDASGLETRMRDEWQAAVARGWDELREAEWVQAGAETAGDTFGSALGDGVLRALDSLPDEIARRLASVARQVDVWAAGQAGRIGGSIGAGSGAGAGRGGGGGGRQPQSLNITNIVNNPVGVPAEDSLQAVGKRNAVTMRLVAPGVQ